MIEGLTHELIIGDPWMRLNSVVYRAQNRTLFIGKDENFARTHGLMNQKMKRMDISMVKHTEFLDFVNRARHKSNSNISQN